MATGTVVYNACVVEYSGGKGRGIMANTAVLSNGNMRGGHTCRGGAVVAGRAITNDIAMVKHGFGEGHRGFMADATICVCLNMIRSLSERYGTIVTG